MAQREQRPSKRFNPNMISTDPNMLQDASDILSHRTRDTALTAGTGLLATETVLLVAGCATTNTRRTTQQSVETPESMTTTTTLDPNSLMVEFQDAKTNNVIIATWMGIAQSGLENPNSFDSNMFRSKEDYANDHFTYTGTIPKKYMRDQDLGNFVEYYNGHSWVTMYREIALGPNGQPAVGRNALISSLDYSGKYDDSKTKTLATLYGGHEQINGKEVFFAMIPITPDGRHGWYLLPFTADKTMSFHAGQNASGMTGGNISHNAQEFLNGNSANSIGMVNREGKLMYVALPTADGGPDAEISQWISKGMPADQIPTCVWKMDASGKVTIPPHYQDSLINFNNFSIG